MRRGKTTTSSVALWSDQRRSVSIFHQMYGTELARGHKGARTPDLTALERQHREDVAFNPPNLTLSALGPDSYRGDAGL